jgi:hypothetical protein
MCPKGINTGISGNVASAQNVPVGHIETAENMAHGDSNLTAGQVYPGSGEKVLDGHPNLSAAQVSAGSGEKLLPRSGERPRICSPNLAIGATSEIAAE